MATTKLIRRRFYAATAAAGAIAAVISVAPLTADRTTTEGAPEAFLNQIEGTGFDHNQAHSAPTPAAIAEAKADVRACRTQPADSPFCADPPSSAATFAAARQAATLQPEENAEPDGLWGPLLQIPTTAIHAIVLPTNKVLFLSQPKSPVETEYDGGNAHVWDPATNTFTAVPPPVVDYPDGPDRPANLWCGGHVQLSDGRVLVAGGNLEYPTPSGLGAGNGFKGAKWVMTFDPWTETWTRYQDMDHGRWYPSLVELPDGRVLILGGWDETGGANNGGSGYPPLMVNNGDVEVFDPATPAGGTATTVVSRLPPGGPNQPKPWPNHEALSLYPHLFVLPSTSVLGAGGNKVLVAGPNRYDSAIIDTDTWIWTDVVDQPDTGQPRISEDRSWGTGWLTPSGVDGAKQVVLLGGSNADGATAPGPGTASPPKRTAEVLDLDEPDDGWRLGAFPSLNTGRSHFNTVLLPDGGIFSNGGGYGRKDDTLYADPVYQAELLRPGAGGWDTVGSEADARTYHSVSVLLPDGRVASAGDDRDIPGAHSPNHTALENRTAQIWSPPYLFDGARPAVTFAPGAVRYGTTFRVAVTGDPSAITRAVLVHPGSVTHAVDMSQRMITLDVTAQPDGLTLNTPRDATVAPPGYHMLFLLNADGVPSVASWVRVAADAPDAPPLPVNEAQAPSTQAPSTPAPPTTPAAPFRVRTLAAKLTGRGPRLTLSVRVKTTAAASARITLLRGRHAVAARTVRLRAGRVASTRKGVRRVALRGTRKVTLRVVITHAGRQTTAQRSLQVPRARSAR